MNVVSPRGSLSESTAKFQEKHKLVQNRYSFFPDPLWLRNCVEPAVIGSLITTKESLQPIRFHLNWSVVHVYNPWWYKPLWTNKEVSSVTLMITLAL